MNLEYFKRKFDTLYKQHDTKREDMAAKTGIDKNKITKLRSHKYSVQPTIDDLIAISDYYNVSIDELLKKDSSDKENRKIENLGDVLKLLFLIDDEIGISIENVSVPDPYIDENTVYPVNEYEKEVNCIYFNDSSLDSFISEWKGIKENVETIPDYGKKMVSLWRKESISKYSHYDRISGFRFNNWERTLDSIIEEELPFN